MNGLDTSSSQAAEARLEGDRAILVERYFDAAPAAVFAAWVEPQRVANWWDPAGNRLAEVDMDVRPGGAFRFVHSPESGGHVFAGTYNRIDPPRLLVFATPAPGGGETVGTLRFQPSGSGTRLILSMECPSAADRDGLLAHGVDKGTAKTLDNLARELAGAAS